MADQAVPDHSLEGLRQRCDPIWIDLGNHDDHVAMPGGMAAVPAHDAEHFGRPRLGQIDRLDDVGADIALGIAAADRVDQDGVLVVEAADLEPRRKDRVPALVIGARGELRDVVYRAVGFYSAQLAKIIDGMTAIARAAADADQKQPPPAVPLPSSTSCRSEEGSAWFIRQTGFGVMEVRAESCHVRRLI
jgi:hypothetical protein